MGRWVDEVDGWISWSMGLFHSPITAMAWRMGMWSKTDQWDVLLGLWFEVVRKHNILLWLLICEEVSLAMLVTIFIPIWWGTYLRIKYSQWKIRAETGKIYSIFFFCPRSGCNLTFKLAYSSLGSLWFFLVIQTCRIQLLLPTVLITMCFNQCDQERKLHCFFTPLSRYFVP